MAKIEKKFKSLYEDTKIYVWNHVQDGNIKDILEDINKLIQVEAIKTAKTCWLKVRTWFEAKFIKHSYDIAEKVMNMAHQIKCHFTTFAEALSKAWDVVKCQNAMAKGSVLLKFQKIDGTITERRVSTNQRLIKTNDLPQGTGVKKSSISVYDLNKRAWISFLPQNFISFKNEFAI